MVGVPVQEVQVLVVVMMVMMVGVPVPVQEVLVVVMMVMMVGVPVQEVPVQEVCNCDVGHRCSLLALILAAFLVHLIAKR
jgi:phosphatidylserine synthase